MTAQELRRYERFNGEVQFLRSENYFLRGDRDTTPPSGRCGLRWWPARSVVARKISGGSRSEAGADAWAKLASLIHSAGQQGQRLLDTIRAMLTAAWAAENPPAILTAV